MDFARAYLGNLIMRMGFVASLSDECCFRTTTAGDGVIGTTYIHTYHRCTDFHCKLGVEKKRGRTRQMQAFHSSPTLNTWHFCFFGPLIGGRIMSPNPDLSSMITYDGSTHGSNAYVRGGGEGRGDISCASWNRVPRRMHPRGGTPCRVGHPFRATGRSVTNVM